MLYDKELPPSWVCGRGICRCRRWDDTGWAWNPRGCPWWVLVDGGQMIREATVIEGQRDMSIALAVALMVAICIYSFIAMGRT